MTRRNLFRLLAGALVAPFVPMAVKSKTWTVPRNAFTKGTWEDLKFSPVPKIPKYVQDAHCKIAGETWAGQITRYMYEAAGPNPSPELLARIKRHSEILHKFSEMT